MHDKLIPILENKHREIAILEQYIAEKPNSDLARVLRGEEDSHPRKSLVAALQHKNCIQVIAEIKRRSPSKGSLAAIANPLNLVEAYVAGGAAAISVLTETTGFGGSLEDLYQVSTALKDTKVPVLRKDFLLEPIQIAESIVSGADIILLIVAILGENLPRMIEAARKMHIEAIVEVHTIEEAKMAVQAGAKIIGVNNRNLHSFHVDTEAAFEIKQHLPTDAITIAESGIELPELARQYYAAGYNAVLVGETLVKSGDPAKWIAACRRII